MSGYVIGRWNARNLEALVETLPEYWRWMDS
jgi:hypothetical protein